MTGTGHEATEVFVMVTEATVQIAGMTAATARSGSARLWSGEGVIKAEVDPAGTARVRYDESRVTDEEIGERVRAAGFDVA